jgi:hypothetical protein
MAVQVETLEKLERRITLTLPATTINGEVEWMGEDPNDRGILEVKNNVVRERAGRVVFED